MILALLYSLTKQTWQLFSKYSFKKKQQQRAGRAALIFL